LVQMDDAPTVTPRALLGFHLATDKRIRYLR
jgi:hypothetical protein